MSVVDGSFDHPLDLEERAATPMAGGILMQGYQCGMLWGAALAAGAEAYRRHGPGPLAEIQAVAASRQLVAAFQARTGEINCTEITEIKWKSTTQGDFMKQILKFFFKGGPVGCFRIAGSYGPAAYAGINETLAETPGEAPAQPVSCTALLAHKMGASDLHTVMASGLAGGIGLSGGACGALGAVIWFMTMQDNQDGSKPVEMTNPKSMAAVERFLEASDYEFECASIVGRKFDHPADHAAYVQSGGCAKLIEELAAIL